MKVSKNIKRIILLIVLAIEGMGGTIGGVLLVAAPDGSFLKMPTEIMRGVFPDFLIPGLILIGMGILNLIAFIVVFYRSRFDWIMSILALGGFIIWFAVEITILGELHWLHIAWGAPVLVGIWAASPLIFAAKEEKININPL